LPENHGQNIMVRTRFAPSPTGYLHIGGARTALFCWLFARKYGGTFVLRIEDTDRERSTPQSIQAILDAMGWLQLDYDEGPYYQTQRFDRYREAIQQLLAAGKAYHCFCTREELDAMRAEQMVQKLKPRYDGRYRDYHGPAREGVEPVVRFKNPLDGEVVIDDLIRGRIVINNEELDDLIIMRADGTPTYNFCVVIDDMDMAISHVIRGDDHINNTPRQINIFKALNFEPPKFAHLPMILGSDGSRLSKRHGAVGVMQYFEDGILPEALLNYLVRLGWSHGDQEIFTREEMIGLFELADVNKSASAFNPEKLLWLNQHYMKESPPQRLADLLRLHLQHAGIDPDSGPDLIEVVSAFRERVKTLKELAEICAFLFKDLDHYDVKAAGKNLTEAATEPLQRLYDVFVELPQWQATVLHDTVQNVTGQLGLKFGKVAQPLRFAITGGAASPSIDVTLALLGREKTLQRIQQALAFITEQSANDAD
jgi:glutamyl-tRNA synthetase